MIKRIYYYFKLKELLEMKELMPFVEYLMRIRKTTLFRLCMMSEIRYWFDCMTIDHNLLSKAQQYAQHHTPITLSIAKRFRQARDIWMKQKKY